jgi:hypothetical protein
MTRRIADLKVITMTFRFVLASIMLITASSGSAQFMEDRVEGTHRICVYQPRSVGTEPLELRVGQGEACPALHSVGKSNQAPATAPLAGVTVEGGDRICTYGSRGRSWGIRVPLTATCPLAAGMLASR